MDGQGTRILCLGNSNTYGYDPCGYFGGRYPAEVRWAGRLRAAGYEVFNRGMNGALTPRGGDAKALLEPAKSLLPLDAVTLMFGTNDVLQGGSAETAAERMGRFLSELRERTGDAAIILIAPPPVTLGDWVQSQSVIRESVALAEHYRALAEAQNLAFADAGQWGVTLTFDGVHFTEEGHAAFYNGLSNTLQTLGL